MRHRPTAPVDAAVAPLRRRAAHLIAPLEPKTRAFLRALPALLSARFRRPSMDADGPGVVRPPRRRRWSRLCEQLDLPPPLSWTLTRPMIQLVLLTPRPDGPTVLVVPVAELESRELMRLQARLMALAPVAARHAPTVSLVLTPLEQLERADFMWGGLLAGSPPLRVEPRPDDALRIFERAPTELSRALTVLAPPDAPCPLELARAGAPPTVLGLLARWTSHPVARAVAELGCAPPTPASLGALSHDLRTACRLALRQLPFERRRVMHERLRPTLFESRVPRPFRPQLEALIATHGKQELQSPDGWQLEVGGLVVALAKGLDQLRASGLAESPALVPPGSLWARILARTQRPGPRMLVHVEPGFLRHLLVSFPKRGRPRARRLDGDRLTAAVLRAKRAGLPIELSMAPGVDAPTIARLSQLVALSSSLDQPLAVQHARKVTMQAGSQTRQLALERAFRRPRRVRFIPENAELGRALQAPASSVPTVNVVAFPDEGAHALLYALDGEARLFVERVERAELAPTLMAWRRVLGQLTPPVALSATVHPTLAPFAGRSITRPDCALTLELAPGRCEIVEVEQERFCGHEALGWRALAEAVLSHWVPGALGRREVMSLRVTGRVGALEVLAARSRVLRRLDLHLRRLAHALRAASAEAA